MAARPFWLIILWKEKYAIWVCSLPENCHIVNQICLISGFQFLKNPSNQQTRYVRGKKGLTDKYDNVGPCVVCWVSEKPWLRDPWELCDLSHMSDDDAKIPISWTSWCSSKSTQSLKSHVLTHYGIMDDNIIQLSVKKIVKILFKQIQARLKW